MQRQNLLIEIGSEELPPSGLLELGEAFAANLKQACNEAGFGGEQVHAFVTPRRIAARLEAVAEAQSDQLIKRKGPLIDKAYDKDGKPLPAAIGFAKSCGVAVSELQILEHEQRLYVQKTVSGQSIKDCMPALLQQTLERLPTGKRMRWGSDDYEFIRPLHWLLALYGDMPLELEVMGIGSGNHTYGHRYHKPEPLIVPHADDYEKLLEQQAKVIPSFDKRLQQIKSTVTAIAKSGELQINDSLLAQVTSIVEWPVAICASFEQSFLKLPAPVITEILEKEQRCFTVLATDGSLASEFVVVANIESSDRQALRNGYERVVRPRLKDADFFINQDRKHPLKHYADSLDGLDFHQRLGSLADKVKRIEALSLAIAQHLSASASAYDFNQGEMEFIKQSARLCKADLRTDIVCEYPELAGFIGSYYAQCDGEVAQVCSAILQHTKPLRAGDSLPQDKIAMLLAIADRLDTLVGIFGIGEYPTGSRDPYALRRASLALIRIIGEYQLDLDLAEWVIKSRQCYTVEIAEDGIAKLLDYLQDRLKHYLIECGFSGDRVAAVSVSRPLHSPDIYRRLLELQSFMQMPQSAELAAANKRIHNILKNNLSENIKEVNQKAFTTDAEHSLYQAFNELNSQVQKLIKQGNYLAALKVLLQLRDPIDNFFDKVLVMSENEGERNNRLALLHQIDCLFMRIADFSELRLDE